MDVLLSTGVDNTYVALSINKLWLGPMEMDN